MGGGDLEGNPRLRAAVAAARANSMPVDNIDRAIKKGSGELEGVNYEDVSYEGYGPGGMAVLIECVTDNRNRTVAEIRHLFDKHGGNLGESNSVSFMWKYTNATCALSSARTTRPSARHSMFTVLQSSLIASTTFFNKVAFSSLASNIARTRAAHTPG